MEDQTNGGANGRRRSGAARMSKLTPAERTSLAKKAAAERWAGYQGGEIYTPEAIGDLPIVGHTIPCAVIVVEGEVIRLVSERDLVKSLGGKRGGSQLAADPVSVKLAGVYQRRPYAGIELPIYVQKPRTRR
jgi:hypothetical protein